MNILVAPDSFKGSLTAAEAAEAIAEGLLKTKKELTIEKLPISDGGDGFIDAIALGRKGVRKAIAVHDPLFRPIQASYFITEENIAIIEMAKASGILLLKPEEYDPCKTTTYGTGELILDAIHAGCEKIIIGLGGSATNDGGCGMLQALGVSLKDVEGNELPFGGSALERLASIDRNRMNPKVKETAITIACDVQNPFYGKEGATYTYGPQKGATKEMLKKLDENLKHFHAMTISGTGFDMQSAKGSGAAGGTGGALMSYCNAIMVPGISLLLEMVSFEERVKKADLIITGEGSLDSQTSYGKAIQGIAQMAKKHQKPLIVICGGIKGSPDDLIPLYQNGVTAIETLTNTKISTNEAMQKAKELLTKKAEGIALKIFEGKYR